MHNIEHCITIVAKHITLQKYSELAILLSSHMQMIQIMQLNTVDNY